PKQSIYRFRRADISLYLRAQRQFVEGEVKLTQNFRSVEPVIAWLNHIFEDLMGDAPADGQAAYVPLAASWPAPDSAAPSVRLIGGPEDENIGPIRAREADELVRAIQAAKADGWPVTETDDGGERRTRDARYADIAVLIPTRTSLPQIEEALERAAVPYRVESRSLVYDTQEVRDLLSILRALDDPTDEVALVAALRSPAYGCGDDDLLRFYQAKGRWDYRRQRPEAADEDNPVVLAMQSLRELHRRRWWEPINVIVEAVIRERRLFELAFAHRRPREHWQRLRFLLDQSRAFAEAGGRTLRQFIDWAERQSEEGTRVVETVVPEPDDDAVRIMTIHAAKGLEFPIVMLAGLNTEKRQQGRQRKAVLWDGDGQMEVSIGASSAGFRTAGYETADAREKLLDEHEKVRLLYVAATRARDHLLLSLHHKAGKESNASLLYERTMQAPELSQRPALPEPAQADSHEESAPFDDGPEKKKAWLEEREHLIELHRKINTMSATDIAKAASGSDDPNLDKDAPVEETPPWRRGRAGTALGRAVHAALQSVDLATGADIASVASAQAAAEGIAGRADEIARMVSAAIASPSLQEAIGGRYWREMYVGAQVEGTRIEGFIDLLYETDAGLVVVDYKTDVVPGQADVEAAVQRYRLQGATYALALQEALGQPVARCVFIFVQPGRAREREIDDLPAAIAEVRQVLAGA
ncbi:MAG: PD-(D/E)XK nuclease family protein, partial [Chloroflexi bacterium]|nr:PD-(D/E)XK nuclease family protein [Chloroflexota bacterium]